MNNRVESPILILYSLDDLRGVKTEWLARYFLSEREWRGFESLESDTRGRDFTAKDAVRLWLARQAGRELVHPAAADSDLGERS